ncbi:MAG: SCO family protein [Chloroflexota bacterium]
MTFQMTRTFFGLSLLVGLSLFFAGCQAFGATYEFNGTVLEPPPALPDFELTAANGQPFHLSDVSGDFALIYFGYTYCPDVCPLTMTDVKEALAELEGRERVHVIFISVDPERDTPEVLQHYVNAFDASFIGLTDNFDKTLAVMKPYGAFAEKEETPDSAAGYLMSHTARLYLVNPRRELILTYPFGFEPEDLRRDLTYLLQQES